MSKPLTQDEIDQLIKDNAKLKGSFSDLSNVINGTTNSIDLTVDAVTSYRSTVIPTMTDIENGLLAMSNAATDVEGTLKFLTLGAQSIQNAFGISKIETDNFKQALADAAPELLKMGIGADQAVKSVIEIGNAFGNTGLVGQEAITELNAASKLTNLSVTELSSSFRGVGVSIYDVGDTMRDVANYAKSVGVSVEAVSKGVVSNLDKMNLYNFENGTKGLTKMSAQAARLGIDMGTVFTLAEKVFNPEGAIELAAGLQRLGVASNDLLDPLRAMDLAQNDPEELQNQIVDLTKSFTKFNQETGKFEILPGEKRRIREIAEEMGILPEKLAEMSIKASEFDMKMKSIEFPTANKEEKELIASLSQISGGTAVIQLRDEKGKQITKEVKNLSPEDIDRLKEQQADASKTIEELAIDQLNELEGINATAAAIARRFSLGVATSEEALRAQKTGNILTSELFKQVEKQYDTKDVRQTASDLFGPIEQSIIKMSKGEISITDLMTTFEGLQTTISNMTVDLPKAAGDLLVNSVVSASEKIKEIYDPVGKDKNKTETNTTKQITVDWNIKGDPNMNKMDLDKFRADLLYYLTQTEEGKSLLKSAVGGKNELLSVQ